MANINKSFNFKGGFQVDEDVLIVRGSNVGIGSQVPTESLDVAGNIKAEGLTLTGSNINLGDASFGAIQADSGLFGDNFEITANTIGPKSGGTQVTYFGDGSNLTNLPTSSWTRSNIGASYEGIYAPANVGVDTNDPRYAFQVGGVPFPKSGLNVNQIGVGIEDGNIDASGIVRTRGTFSGDGSSITNLDASAVQIGKLSNDVLPDNPTFTTVTATNFFGTADFALSLDPASDITVNTLSATEVTGTTEVVGGRLKAGDDLVSSDFGEIIAKNTARATIYSVSNSSGARVFVGSQVESGTNRRFGGLRYAISDDQDLDLVNYGFGNINYYLHFGSGNSTNTTGAFRWIYTKGGGELANLDRFGKLSLLGNTQSGEDTLSVGGDVSITGITSIQDDTTIEGNLTVGGDIVLGGNIAIPNPVFNTVEVSSLLTVGLGTASGGVTVDNGGGVGLSTLVVYSGQSVVSTIANGDASFTGNVTSNNITATNQISGASINVSNSINGPSGFVVNASGLSASSGDIDSITSGVGTFISLETTNLSVSNSLNVSSLTATGTVSANSLQGSNATITGSAFIGGGLELNNSNVNTTGILTAGNSFFGNVEVASVTATGTVNTPSITATASVETPQINTPSGQLNIGAEVISNGIVRSNSGSFASSSNVFELSVSGSNLIINIFNSTGSIGIGSVTLPIV